MVTLVPQIGRSLPEYGYEPLRSPQYFRLLKIGSDSSSTFRGAYIQCFLQTFDRETAPPYKCLSYTWSNPLQSDQTTWYDVNLKRKRKILCDGKSLEVTSNLYDALKYLQKHEDLASSFVWIDAICINQANLLERSQQVKVMGRIYFKAEMVIVWLGKEANHSNEAMLMIREWASNIREIGSEELHERIQQAPLDDDRFFAAMQLSKPSVRQWRAFFDLLTRKWFSRAWVMQELVVAKSARLVCGDQAIDWTDFRTFTFFISDEKRFRYWLDVFSERHKLRDHDDELKSATRFGVVEYVLHDRDEEKTPVQRLIRVLEMMSGLQATDLRDNVFAPIALVHYKGEEIIDSEPDYNKTVRQIFIELTYSIICRDKSYIVFRLLGEKRRQMASLPSWVPGFDHLVSSEVFQCNPKISVGTNAAWQFVQPSLDASTEELTAPAFTYDTVSTIIHRTFGNAANLESWIHLAQEFSDSVFMDCGCTKLQLLITCLRMGHCFHTSPLSPESLEGVPSSEDVLQSYLDRIQYDNICQIKLHNDSQHRVISRLDGLDWWTDPNLDILFDQGLLPTRESLQEVSEIYCEASSLIQAKKEMHWQFFTAVFERTKLFERETIGNGYVLFKSEKGAVGACRGDVQGGDKILFFPGSDAPYVARERTDGTWNLLGGTYLHALMHGEALAEYGGSMERDVQTIRLR